MTTKELAKQPATEVRKDPEKMRLYIERYKAVFNSTPNCAACSFSRDFKKFKTTVLKPNFSEPEINNLKTTTMAKKQNFELKREHRNQILTYRKNGRPYRSYGNKLTDEFVDAFLKEGSKEEIAERRKLFVESKKANKGNSATAKANAPGQQKKQEVHERNAERKAAKELEKVQERNLEEFEKEVAKIDSVEELEQLREIEDQQENPRKGAYEIIDARIAELQEEEEEEEEETPPAPPSPETTNPDEIAGTKVPGQTQDATTKKTASTKRTGKK